MKSVEEYFSLHYDLKNEMIRLSKEGNDIRKAFITKIYSRPKIPSIQRLDFSYLLER